MKKTFIWHLLWVCSLTHVTSANMEGSGFTTVSAASHQGANGSFRLHFRRAALSSIFICSQWCNNNMCFTLNSWHLLAVTWLVFTVKIFKYISPGSEISHWHSLLSAGSNTVIVSCMDVGDFTFTSALCFDSVLCVLMQSRVWCEFEWGLYKDSPVRGRMIQTDREMIYCKSVASTPFQISHWIMRTHPLTLFFEWLDLEMGNGF